MHFLCVSLQEDACILFNPFTPSNTRVNTNVCVANAVQNIKSSERTSKPESPVATAPTGRHPECLPPYLASVFELDQSDESDAFALWCHLADLDDIRMSVKETWHEFSQGKLTLDVAGVITETAFGMMKQIHEEFIALKPRFKAWWGLSLFLGLKTAYNNNVVYTFSKDPMAKVAEAQSEMKQADLICAAAALLLRVFREACQMSLAGTLKYKKNFWDQCYPTNLIGGRPTTDFEAILFSFVPEITALAACDRVRQSDEARRPHYHTYYTNELTTLIPLNSEPIEPPIWLVIATQTCMDIQDAFDVASYPAVLRSAGLRTKSIVHEYSQFHQEQQCASPVPAEDKKYLARISRPWETIESATTPSRQGDKEGFASRLFLPGLRVLPHLGGEINYLMKIQMHSFGTRVANDYDAVVYMAHIYKAGKVELNQFADLADFHSP